MEIHQVQSNSGVVKVDSKEYFESLITQTNNHGYPVFIHFTASWCVPPLAMNSFMEELATTYHSILFLSLDVDEVKEVAKKMEVKAMPTFVLMKDGAVSDKIVGANPDEIRKRIDAHLCPAVIADSLYHDRKIFINYDAEVFTGKEKLLSSKNRTESSLGKRLKIDILAEVEKIHKRKERLLKKQHRQALLLDNFATADLSSGRSLRDRKPVTYTFDDSDQSINEAIKITKKNQDSPNNIVKKEGGTKPEPSTNGRLNGTSHASQQVVYETLSPKSIEDEETDAGGNLQENNLESRWRKRPQGYSDNYYVEASLDNYADSDSDDIVGEAVYDEDYLKVRKQKKVSSSSEGDEEYRWEENANEDEEEEDLLSMSDEDTDEQHNPYKKPLTRSRRGAKSTAISNIQSGLRRSKRSARPRIDYRQYELSESDVESEKPDMSAGSEDSLSDASNNDMEPSENHEKEDVEEVLKVEKINEDSPHGVVEKEHCQSTIRADESPSEGGVKERRLLDLNQLAPGTSFEDGPKDEDTDNL